LRPTKIESPLFGGKIMRHNFSMFFSWFVNSLGSWVHKLRKSEYLVLLVLSLIWDDQGLTLIIWTSSFSSLRIGPMACVMDVVDPWS
jgi:hypothetical protein